jgi:Zn-dependent M28 family amino/carboxypeptidase
VNPSFHSFGSDHVSFQRAGIPAVLLIELDDTDYPNYHRSTDVLNDQNVNGDQSIAILRGLAASVYELAQQ